MKSEDSNLSDMRLSHSSLLTLSLLHLFFVPYPAMSPALEQLVREAMEVTGAPKPVLLEDDAPVLTDAALAGGDEGFYLVGLIGGKDVGKSALVNALVGKPITAVTSHGAGTEIVIAYTHSSQGGGAAKPAGARGAGAISDCHA